LLLVKLQAAFCQETLRFFVIATKSFVFGASKLKSSTITTALFELYMQS
jgi:hypothetical protein